MRRLGMDEPARRLTAVVSQSVQPLHNSSFPLLEERCSKGTPRISLQESTETSKGDMSGELPVWVRGERVTVKGVDKKTTCKEVIEALTGGGEGWVLAERWGGVEKRLGGEEKVWRLWKAWGAAREGEVRIRLRRRRRGIGELLGAVLAHWEGIRQRLQELRPLHEEIRLWEDVAELNERLQEEEDSLGRLYSRLGESIVLEELRRAEAKSRELARQLHRSEYHLSRVDLRLNRRKRRLKELHHQLEATELETDRLLRSKAADTTPATRVLPDLDSNSDTGLGSLHSSSEEGTYVLDTVL